MSTCKPPQFDALEACAKLSRRRLAPAGGGKPGESPAGGGKPGEYDEPGGNVLRGTITDIAEAMSHARTLPLPDKDAWRTSRVADQDVLGQTDQ